MKKSVIFLSVVLLLVFAGFTGLDAGSVKDSAIQDRIAHQQERINQGISNGSLTPQEAQDLQGRLNHVREEETRLKEDGRLTAQERARLQRMLDRTNQQIYRKKHNAARRP